MQTQKTNSLTFQNTSFAESFSFSESLTRGVLKPMASLNSGGGKQNKYMLFSQLFSFEDFFISCFLAVCYGYFGCFLVIFFISLCLS